MDRETETISLISWRVADYEEKNVDAETTLKRIKALLNKYYLDKREENRREAENDTGN